MASHKFRSQLVPGKQYKTKIGRDWQLVTVTTIRDEIPGIKPDGDVIVRTGAGNLIYRSPRQLKALD